MLLIDTRDRLPEPDPEDRPGEPWPLALLSWLLPWPALIVWLCVASRLTDGWLSVATIYLAVGLSAWRGLRAFPASGLDENRQ